MASTQVLSGLKELLWQVYELEESVRHGVAGPEQQAMLEQRIQALSLGMREVADRTGALEDLSVPVNLLRHLDEGGWPDHYTSESFKVSVADNQASKGKVAAVSTFRTELLTQLAAQLPEETAQYRRICEGEAAAIKVEWQEGDTAAVKAELQEGDAAAVKIEQQDGGAAR